jgi:SnoaL-like polyketide cyclase
MPEEDNAALVAKFLDELWNKQNLAIIDQLTTEDYVVHIPQGDLLGREALKIVAVHYFESFSFIQLGIGNQTSQNSQVVTHIEWDTALYFRDQSLDQEIKREIPARGVSIDRIFQGQIAESWNMLDTLYWLFNIKELSRNPDFVRTLPASSKRPCPSGQCPKGKLCHACPNK